MQNWKSPRRARVAPQGRSGKVKHIVGDTPTIRFNQAYVDHLNRDFDEWCKAHPNAASEMKQHLREHPTSYDDARGWEERKAELRALMQRVKDTKKKSKG